MSRTGWWGLSRFPSTHVPCADCPPAPTPYSATQPSDHPACQPRARPREPGSGQASIPGPLAGRDAACNSGCEVAARTAGRRGGYWHALWLRNADTARPLLADGTRRPVMRLPDARRRAHSLPARIACRLPARGPDADTRGCLHAARAGGRVRVGDAAPRKPRTVNLKERVGGAECISAISAGQDLSTLPVANQASTCLGLARALALLQRPRARLGRRGGLEAGRPRRAQADPPPWPTPLAPLLGRALTPRSVRESSLEAAWKPSIACCRDTDGWSSASHASTLRPTCRPPPPLPALRLRPEQPPAAAPPPPPLPGQRPPSSFLQGNDGGETSGIPLSAGTASQRLRLGLPRSLLPTAPPTHTHPFPSGGGGD